MKESLIAANGPPYIWLGADYNPVTNSYEWFNGDPVNNLPVHSSTAVSPGPNRKIVLTFASGMYTTTPSLPLPSLCEATSS